MTARIRLSSMFSIMAMLLLAAMEHSCHVAASILSKGGSAKDAVIQATVVLEVLSYFIIC